MSSGEGRVVGFFAAFSFDFDLHKHKLKADRLNSLRKNTVSPSFRAKRGIPLFAGNRSEGFLALLGMTELVHFSGTGEACGAGRGFWSESLLLKSEIFENL